MGPDFDEIMNDLEKAVKDAETTATPSEATHYYYVCAATRAARLCCQIMSSFYSTSLTTSRSQRIAELMERAERAIPIDQRYHKKVVVRRQEILKYISEAQARNEKRQVLIGNLPEVVSSPL